MPATTRNPITEAVTVTVTLPGVLFDAVQARSDAEGLPLQAEVITLIENALWSAKMLQLLKQGETPEALDHARMVRNLHVLYDAATDRVLSVAIEDPLR